MLLDVGLRQRTPPKHQRPFEDASLEVVDQHVAAGGEAEGGSCRSSALLPEHRPAAEWRRRRGLAHLMSLSLMTSITGQGTFLRSM